MAGSSSVLMMVVGLVSILAFGFAATVVVYGLREDFLAKRRTRLFPLLVTAWMALVSLDGILTIPIGGSSSKLLGSVSPASTMVWWFLINMMLITIFFFYRLALSEKKGRAILWWAVALNLALVLSWPLALNVTAIPLTLPVDLALVYSWVVLIVVGTAAVWARWRELRK